jgi:excisionase family DNA binding protein
MKNQNQRFLRIREASEKLGISPSTLRRWASKNIVKVVRSYPRAHRRFSLSEVEKLLSDS